MKYPKLSAVALALAGTILVPGCAETTSENGNGALSESGSAPSEIRVSGPASPPSLPVLRMIETDALGDTDIVFEQWETADQLTASVTGGGEFIAAPLTTGAMLAENGGGIQLLNVSAWAVMGLVTSDESIQDVEDLAGKQVHVAMRASAVDYTTQLVLETHGLTDSVEVSYIDPLNGPEQFMAGQIENLVTVEPQVTMLLNNSPDARSIVDFDAEWKEATGEDLPLPTAGTFVNAEFAERHPETVAEFNEAYAEAAAWVTDNPDAAGELAGQELGMPAPVVSAAIPEISWQVQNATEAHAAVELYFTEMFQRWPESVGGALPGEDFYLQ